MADIEHSTIPDAGRHEPKGASTAAIDTVMKSDGAGSTVWEKVDYSELTGAPPVPVRQGWWYYHDDTTGTTPIALTSAATEYKLTNDGAGADNNVSNAYPASSNTWNTSTNQLSFSSLTINDTVDIRLSLVINTTNANSEVQLRINLGIGGSDPYSVELSRLNYKTSGAYDFTIFDSIPLRNSDTINFPAEIVAEADATGVTVEVVAFYIRALHNG